MGNPMLEIRLNGTIIQSQKFDQDSLCIGRLHDNDIVIDDLAISRVHAKLTKCGADIILEDQSSENGCFLNGLRIRRAAIQPEDEVLLARYQLKLRSPSVNTEPVAASTLPGPELRQEMGTIFNPPNITIAQGKAVLVLRSGPGGEKVFSWDKPEILIGRGGNCEISLFEAQVARRHARLLREDDRYVIEDLQSANGTKVNGKPISTHGLAPGDIITIGTHEIVFQIENADDETTVQHSSATESSDEATLRADAQRSTPATTDVTLPTAQDHPLSDTAPEISDTTRFEIIPPAAAASPPPPAPTISEELRVTPIEAILQASLQPPQVVSSLFDTGITLVGVDSQGTIKTPVTPRTPPPLPKPPHLPKTPPPATEIKTVLRPELVATQIKVRPQVAPEQELALEIAIDLDALEPEVRSALRQLAESGIELPAKIRLRAK